MLIVAGTLTTASDAAGGVYLLVDNHHIESTNLTRVVSTPVKHPQPIVDGENDHNYTPYVTVIREGGVFRMWYAAKPSDTELRLGYTTSTDGVHFGPRTLLPVPTGYQWGASIIRDTRGFLMPYYARARESSADDLKGISFARSTDGFAWQATTPDPKYRLGELGLGPKDGDITSMVKFRGRYLLFIKMGGSGYPGSTPHMPYPGYRRLVGVMESTDGEQWTKPRAIFAPDDQDPGVTEFYGLGGVVERGGMLIGFLRVLRDDINEGVGHTVLAWSHDGVNWHRDRQPFLNRGNTWDAAMAWADAQTVAGNRTFIYYGGYKTGHKNNPYTERQLGVATIPTDRYVARAGTGHLTTKPVRLNGRLRVNAQGKVRVTFLQAGKKPVSCLARTVVPCAVKGVARIRFSVSGRLYSFST